MRLPPTALLLPVLTGLAQQETIIFYPQFWASNG